MTAPDARRHQDRRRNRDRLGIGLPRGNPANRPAPPRRPKGRRAGVVTAPEARSRTPYHLECGTWLLSPEVNWIQGGGGAGQGDLGRTEMVGFGTVELGSRETKRRFKETKTRTHEVSQGGEVGWSSDGLVLELAGLKRGGRPGRGRGLWKGSDWDLRAS